jgi:CRISPR-associated protein Cas2
VSEMQFVILRRRLLDCIKTEEDNLRIYRLVEPRERYVEAYGKNLYVDFNDPLVL